jgi:Predicted acyltransferase
MNFISKTFDELSSRELYEILKARSQIFILEQHIEYQDMDDIDYQSLHCFMSENDKVVAYLRAFYKEDYVQVGRILTLKHGLGYGRMLLEQSLPIIQERMKCQKICMDAQKHAVGFYEKFGFQVTSDEFLEEGILHVVMELTL